MLSHRKGSTYDLIVIAVLVLVGAIVLIVVGSVWAEFVAVANAIPIVGGNANASAAIIDTSSALLLFDVLFIVYLMGLGLVSIILAYFVEAHPVMFVISFIVLIISVIVSALFTNIFIEFTTIDSLATSVASYPLTVTAMKALPGYIAIIGVLMLIALYKRRPA